MLPRLVSNSWPQAILLVWASQSIGIIGMTHHARPLIFLLLLRQTLTLLPWLECSGAISPALDFFSFLKQSLSLSPTSTSRVQVILLPLPPE